MKRRNFVRLGKGRRDRTLLEGVERIEHMFCYESGLNFGEKQG